MNDHPKAIKSTRHNDWCGSRSYHLNQELVPTPELNCGKVVPSGKITCRQGAKLYKLR